MSTRYHFSFLLFTVLAVIFLCTLTSAKRDPKNPPTGQTGAPGETTCSTAAGCHNGGNYGGTVSVTGLPDMLMPSTTYDVTLTLNSTCSKTGFQMTVLDKNAMKCGDLLAGTNNNLKVVNGRQYIRQTNANTMSGGKSSYSFKWKSPATITQDTAYFYYVMLQANGNGNTSGDNVAKGVKKSILPQSSSAEETVLPKIDIFPNPAQQYLHLQVPTGTSCTFQLVSPSGKICATGSLNDHLVLDVSSLSAGIYLVRFSNTNWKHQQQVSIIH